MFCPKCGKELRKGAVFCPSCGTRIQTTSSPLDELPRFENLNKLSRKETFILSPKGRIGSSEFLKWYLPIAIWSWFAIVFLEFYTEGVFLNFISALNFILFWPSLCIAFKRLHDAGKSGWIYTLAYLFPVVGVSILFAENDFILTAFALVFDIVLILSLYLLKSDKGSNRYGEKSEEISLKRNSSYTFSMIYSICFLALAALIEPNFIATDENSFDLRAELENYYTQNAVNIFESEHHPFGEIKGVTIDDIRFISPERKDEFIVTYTIYSSTPLTSNGFTQMEALWKLNHNDNLYYQLNCKVVATNIMGSDEFWSNVIWGGLSLFL